MAKTSLLKAKTIHRVKERRQTAWDKQVPFQESCVAAVTSPRHSQHCIFCTTVTRAEKGLAAEGDKCSGYFRVRTKFLISKCPYLVETFRAEFLQSVIVHMALSLKLTQKHVHKA